MVIVVSAGTSIEISSPLIITVVLLLVSILRSIPCWLIIVNEDTSSSWDFEARLTLSWSVPVSLSTERTASLSEETISAKYSPEAR